MRDFPFRKRFFHLSSVLCCYHRGDIPECITSRVNSGVPVGEPQEQRQTVPWATAVDDISQPDLRHYTREAATVSDTSVAAPVVMADECDSVLQTFVGNGKKIDLCINSGVLRVVGNSCFVTVAKNEGHIVITGNKGHLQVHENRGCIRYTGNHGLVEVGTASKDIGRVVYTGNGGKVKRMKMNAADGKCDVEGSCTRNPSPSKQQDGHQAKKVEAHNELIVNGINVCISSKAKKDSHQRVTKENVSPEKLERTSRDSGHCCCHESKKAWRQTSSKIGEEEAEILISRLRNFEAVNLSNFELENWCLNLATELISL
jgi:hypothetical protein